MLVNMATYRFVTVQARQATEHKTNHGIAAEGLF